MHYLERIRERYPVAFHGTGLSLGSADALDFEHLRRLRAAIEHFQPPIVSEHLSWSALDGQHFNDLLPIPYTDESFALFCDRVRQAQDTLDRQLLIENPSSYGHYAESQIPEWEFYSALPAATGCALLLDLNNVHVNAHNHGFDTDHYLNAVNPADVQQYHLAGYTANTTSEGIEMLIDDHGSSVSDPVWELFRRALKRIGQRPTLVEWDSRIPDFSVLQQEAVTAQAILDTCAPNT